MTRRGQAFWKKTVNEFDSSGLEQREFCEQQGLRLGTFQKWLYKLRSGEPSRLVRVAAVGGGEIDSGLELRLARGVALRFNAEVEPTYVAALVSALDA